ncbi:MAG TPA: TcpQ domain-containing protein [Alphaproteobacteria bacterium]|nr:TcpQ domain-containing protein [Alphaproteobacteria bacterium]
MKGCPKVSMRVVKMIKFFVLLMVTGIIVVGPRAMAQEQQAVPKFAPVSGWQVGNTVLSKERGFSGLKLPCMATVSYDNGYVVRLSGGGQKILAMAIDFRQNVFHQGRKYPVTLRMGQAGGASSTMAVAFSQSTLLFNLRSLTSFYQQIAVSPYFELDVDGNTMIFELGDIQKSLTKLEQCYDPSAAASTTVAENMPAGVPLSGNVETDNSQENSPAPVAEVKWDDEITPLPSETNRLRQVEMRSATQSMVWTAKAGDGLQETLQKWSHQAGVTLDWKADSDGQVVSDLEVEGDFEEAVQNLMAQNSAALGIEANLMTPQQKYAAPQSLVPPVSPSSMGVVSRAYVAPVGASLQAVLENWSGRAGVDFVWTANEDFRVKSAVNENSYETALQSLLGQYENDKLRPAAQLNNDPETGQRLLSVESTRVR